MKPATVMPSQAPTSERAWLDDIRGDSSASPTADPASRRSKQRRRLWQLPTQAHELLLALSFTPEWLRRETARTLGQVHKGQCVLKGRDVDVLYNVVHDMVTRNALSEAMHRHLDARHAVALLAMGKAKDELALRAAWALALADDGPPAALPAQLWAVLTHPLGEALQSMVLYDARAWVFAHARRSVDLAVAQHQTDTLVQQARERADQLQGRLTNQQQRATEALQQAHSVITHLKSELTRWQATAMLVNPPKAVVHCVQRGAAPAGVGGHDRARVQRPAVASAPASAVLPAPEPIPVLDAHLEPSARPAAALDVAGRRVLCVGGIRHAVALYRGRIEKLGGRFDHHDGGIEDGIQALDARLGRADVVICQAACINHEAYHRVKRHCERTGTPCVYLDRPSLSRLDRALKVQEGDPHACR
jgi:hypothetical protein